MSRYLTTKDYFNTYEEFHLEYVTELDMLQTYPVPKNLNTYYDHPEYISHTDSKKTLINKIYQVIKYYSLNKKVRLIKKLRTTEKTILDIGAGTGDFLKYAQKDGWEIHGVEPNKQARLKALTKEITLKESPADIPEEKFDVITLWHVLEHLPDLKTEISNIQKKLKLNGYLVIAVPNYKSYDAKHYKQFWAAYDTPRHLWHFSKESINRLFKPYKLHLVQTKPMLFDSFYVSLLSEKYKTGKNNYIKAFLIGLTSNFKGLFTKEYSSHIYILQKSK
ncbi:class I SAM-dependent methyltransferase [Maribacter algicola]|uniref:Class I SAM-dependent methyltransferase n=1 Tax=Maribacter algicola TaxID=2498892 RepID=A0A426RM81_9FLAO|nr:class I SAM-dependent methyltransferase [Maribacter algicola]RRQ50049.1 class I SAM-dependent methyltransferase [Maribacter algicola]